MAADATPQNAQEGAFASAMLGYLRRAGAERAWALLERLAMATADGATRDDLTRIVADELTALPNVH